MSRPLIHGRQQILVGDRTSHGGVVLTGTSVMTYGDNEIPFATKNCWVSCPKCRPHKFRIAEGEDRYTIRGVPTAVEGMRTECGAILIADKSWLDAGFSSLLGESKSLSDLEHYFEVVSDDGHSLDLAFVTRGVEGELQEGRLGAGGRTRSLPMERLVDITLWVPES